MTIFKARNKLKCKKILSKNSRWQMFFKIDVLKNFAILMGKHLYWSLFLIKLQAWRQERCFTVNIVTFLKATFFIDHFQWTPHRTFLIQIPQGVLSKKFLKILKDSQESTYVRVSFLIKLQVSDLHLY